MRIAIALLSPLLISASAVPALPDVNESGRVLATLDDWRAFIFCLLVLLFLQVIERWIAGWRHGQALDRAISAIEKSTASDATNAVSFSSFAMTLSRLESYLVRAEHEQP